MKSRDEMSGNVTVNETSREHSWKATCGGLECYETPPGRRGEWSIESQELLPGDEWIIEAFGVNRDV